MDNKKYKGARRENAIDEKSTDKVEPLTSGMVANCVCVNVRKEPRDTSESLCVIDRGTEVKVDPNESTAIWYKVCLASGVEGFCKKPYIAV